MAWHSKILGCHHQSSPPSPSPWPTPTRHRASTSIRWHFAFGAMLS